MMKNSILKVTGLDYFCIKDQSEAFLLQDAYPNTCFLSAILISYPSRLILKHTEETEMGIKIGFQVLKNKSCLIDKKRAKVC